MFLSNNPIDRFALSCDISSRMAACKVHSNKARKLKSKIKKIRREAREEFNKAPNLPGEGYWGRERRFDEYLKATKPYIIKMDKAFKAHSKEALKQTITREEHLAHSYLKGRTYNQCERTCRERPSASMIVKCIPKSHKPEIAFLQEFGLKTYIEMWLHEGNLTRKDIEEKEDQERAIRIAEDAVERAEGIIEAFDRRFGPDLSAKGLHRVGELAAETRKNKEIRDAAKQRLDALKELPAAATT